MHVWLLAGLVPRQSCSEEKAPWLDRQYTWRVCVPAPQEVEQGVHTVVNQL